MTALWIYDYLLTLEDEVTGFHDGNDAERNLTTAHRSVMHGRRRAYSVRNLPHFQWHSLTNGISVFSLFLFVSALRYHHYLPDHRLV